MLLSFMFVLKQTLPFDIFVDLDVMFMYRKIAQHSNKELKIRQIFAWYKVTSACHCACHRVHARADVRVCVSAHCLLSFMCFFWESLFLSTQQSCLNVALMLAYMC